ncbi:hypothetical protein NJ76_25465 [Rhodococcus sp. IITR03]|nr:hypothetical protein NJ76_25465 [Rhodococcus sp. IITR03]
MWAQMNDKTIVADLSRANQEMVSIVSTMGALTSLELMNAYDAIGPLIRETTQMLRRFDVVLSSTTSMLAGPAESTMDPRVCRCGELHNRIQRRGHSCGIDQLWILQAGKVNRSSDRRQSPP